MLSIPCPFCGPRAEIEFVCGGPAHIERPGPPEAVSDAQWAAYLFLRDNPKGLLTERWQHIHGCGDWFTLRRDTVTHAIVQSHPMGQAPTEAAT